MNIKIEKMIEELVENDIKIIKKNIEDKDWKYTVRFWI